MKVFAYCSESFKDGVKRAAGVEPLTCPPMIFQKFKPSYLEGHDLIYLKLHGLPEQPYWYGDAMQTALSASIVRQADLSRAVVFVAACFLPESPMLQALKDAGARAVIGGSGVNYGGVAMLTGVDLLGQAFRAAFARYDDYNGALKLAKMRLRMRLVVDEISGNETAVKVCKDTLGFEVL